MRSGSARRIAGSSRPASAGLWAGACKAVRRELEIDSGWHRNLYTLAPDGLKFAIFYTKVHDRLLRPLLAAGQPPAPPVIGAALRIIDRHLANRLADSRLPTAA